METGTMLECEITIINRLGLHARAAAKLVSLAAGFGCDIRLQKDQHEVNAKSIMGVLMLAASQGTRLTLRADGDDAEQALQQIQALIERRFDESE